MSEIKNRYEFMLLFDVQDGNPNGDPDLGNQPRMDLETGQGLVTDVCLKRKIRNYVMMTRGDTEGCDIFVKEKAVLNKMIEAAWDKAAGGKKPEEIKKNIKEKQKTDDEARRLMCAKYFDIRAFGAVLTTGEKNAGQVRGPIQMTFARSFDPIAAVEHSITRMAVTNEKDEEKERTMGRKYTVPYALYAARGFVSPQLAAQTGFSQEDLELLWEALQNMFEFDRSAARGLMTTRRLIVFKHATALGCAPAESLFERVACRLVDGVRVPRKFSDYEVTLDGEPLTEVMKVVEVG